MSLFRAEVLTARKSSYLGNIRLAQPIAFSVIAAGAMLAAAAFAAFLTVAEVTRKTSVSGVLVPAGGAVRVTTPQAGTLVELLIEEGAIVSRGQALLRVSTERITQNGAMSGLVGTNISQRRTELEEERHLRTQQARQKRESLALRIASAERELAQADAELKLSNMRSALARKSLNRYQQLSGEGFVSASQVQQKQEEELEFESRTQTAKRVALAAARELTSLQGDFAAVEVQLRTELTQINRNLAGLNHEQIENDARMHIVVTAPIDGQISASSLHIGKSLDPSQTLLTIVPTGPGNELQAQLYTTSRGIGFVEKGQRAVLRYAAYPYAKFGMGSGAVVGVTRTPIAPADLPVGQAQALLSAAQANEPLYRIDVRLSAQAINAYGNLHPLKPGMTVEADVVRERVAVWEWLLEPLIAASRRVSGTAAAGPRIVVEGAS